MLMGGLDMFDIREEGTDVLHPGDLVRLRYKYFVGVKMGRYFFILQNI